MANKRDYYEILGLGRDADEAELKAKYGLITLSANIDSSRDPGRVNCNLVLTRAVSTS